MVEAKWLKAAQWLTNDKCFVQLPNGDLMNVECHDSIPPRFDVSVSGEIAATELGLSSDEVDVLWSKLVRLSQELNDQVFAVDLIKEREMIERDETPSSTWQARFDSWKRG